MKTYIFIFLVMLNTSVFAQGSKKELQSLSSTYKSISPEDWGRGTFGVRRNSWMVKPLKTLHASAIKIAYPNVLIRFPLI